MLSLKKKQHNTNLTKEDLKKFYALFAKYSKLSDIIGVVSEDFNSFYKQLKKRYDKTYTVLANTEARTIIVVKEDFLKKYVFIDNIEELIDKEYKFGKYI